jgi:hypothetical protein
MQEVTGSSPVSPTNHPIHAQSDPIIAPGCPLPVDYSKQRWIAILNPSHDTVRDTLKPLIADGQRRLAAHRMSRDR